MLLVRRFYPKPLTYSILWAIPTGALWGEVSQGHNDMLTAVGFEPVTPDPNTNVQPTAPHASVFKNIFIFSASEERTTCTTITNNTLLENSNIQIPAHSPIQLQYMLMKAPE